MRYSSLNLVVQERKKVFTEVIKNEIDSIDVSELGELHAKYGDNDDFSMKTNISWVANLCWGPAPDHTYQHRRTSMGPTGQSLPGGWCGQIHCLLIHPD